MTTPLVTNEKLAKVKCFLFDLDGTVYLGGIPIPGAVDAVRRTGGRFMFLTNNSSASRLDYVKKLSGMGFPVSENNVYTSGNATAEYLNANYAGKKIFLFGNRTLRGEFEAAGVTLEEDKPDLIVVGFDTTFDYARLTRLCDLIREGVPYICTHADINCPTETGYKPDVGSFIALIEKSTGVSPLLVCGKPHAIMAECIRRKLGLKSYEIAMVGDRLATDMKFGVDNGFVSVLVLSGEATEEDLRRSGLKVDVVVPSIAHIDFSQE